MPKPAPIPKESLVAITTNFNLIQQYLNGTASEIARAITENRFKTMFDIADFIVREFSDDRDYVYFDKTSNRIFGRVGEGAYDFAPCSIEEYKNHMYLMFKDDLRLRFKTRDSDGELVYKAKNLSKEQWDAIFKNFLSRIERSSKRMWLDSLPEWDGDPRMNTFLKKYMEIDCPPSIWRSFLSAIVAKCYYYSEFSSPKELAKSYYPYSLYIVGDDLKKGVGKSWLFERLMESSIETCKTELTHSSNRTIKDLNVLFRDVYASGAALFNDDEMKLYESLGYDSMKSLVTQKSDTFDYKFMGSMNVSRGFVMCGSTNRSCPVRETNERRFIFLNTNLRGAVRGKDNKIEKPAECRIKELDTDFFNQMMAEAYYVFRNNDYSVIPHDEAADEYLQAALQDNYEPSDADLLLLEYMEQAKKSCMSTPSINPPLEKGEYLQANNAIMIDQLQYKPAKAFTSQTFKKWIERVHPKKYNFIGRTTFSSALQAVYGNPDINASGATLALYRSNISHPLRLANGVSSKYFFFFAEGEPNE